ncbi:MAG: hypothetical protein KDA83_12120 [Planctomycetales bacterium]|nr:hypothetical protein [Planctomycetales bacterium]
MDNGWQSYTFTYQPIVNLAPEITSFSLLVDTGTSNTDSITSTTTVHGTITDGTTIQSVAIEFDEDGDDIAEDAVFTDAKGRFIYTPTPGPYGTRTIRARAVQWDKEAGEYLFSDWQSITFTQEAQANQTPQLADVRRASELEEERIVGIVPAPVIVGRLVDDGPLEGREVEIDLNQDGTIDAFARSDAYGEFAATLLGVAPGEVNIRVRARELDLATGNLLVSDWSNLTFNLSAPSSTVAGLQTLGLANDDGADNADLETTDPTITGTVSSADDGAQRIVEIDNDGDGIIDASVAVAADGTFSYTPTDLATGQSHQLKVRIRTVPLGEVAITGAWQTLDFTLVQAEPVGHRFVNFNLKVDTGTNATDGSTSNAELEGQITGGDTVEGVLVDIDYNGDGYTDATVVTDVDGKFTYTPETPNVGYQSVTARIRDDEYASAGSGLVSAQVNFVYNADPDSTEAQSIASAFASYDTAWQSAQSDYSASVLAARLAYTTASQTSRTNFEDAISALRATWANSVNTANQTYSTAMGTAADARANALTQLASNYQTDLTANGASWSAARPDLTENGSLIFANMTTESSGSTASGTDAAAVVGPEAALPTLSPNMMLGQADLLSDPEFQALAQADFDSTSKAISAVNNAYEQMLEWASAKAAEAQKDLLNQYNDAIDQAHDAYNDALIAIQTPDSATTGRATRDEAVAKANTEYDQKLLALTEELETQEFNQVATSSDTTFANTKAAADALYWVRYSAAMMYMMSGNYPAYEAAIRDAEIERQQTIGNAEIARATSKAAVGKKYADKRADALFERDKAIAEAEAVFEKAQNADRKTDAEARIAAYTQFLKDLDQAWVDYQTTFTVNVTDVTGAGLIGVMGYLAETVMGKSDGNADPTLQVGRSLAAITADVDAKDRISAYEMSLLITEIGIAGAQESLANQQALLQQRLAQSQDNVGLTFIANTIENELAFYAELLGDGTSTTAFVQSLEDDHKADRDANLEELAADVTLALGLVAIESGLNVKLADAHDDYQVSRVLADQTRADASSDAWRDQLIGAAAADRDETKSKATVTKNRAVALAQRQYDLRISLAELKINYETSSGTANKTQAEQALWDVYSAAVKTTEAEHDIAMLTDGDQAADLQRTSNIAAYKKAYYSAEKSRIDSMADNHKSLEVAISTAYNETPTEESQGSGYDLSIFDAYRDQSEAYSATNVTWVAALGANDSVRQAALSTAQNTLAESNAEARGELRAAITQKAMEAIAVAVANGDYSQSVAVFMTMVSGLIATTEQQTSEREALEISGGTDSDDNPVDGTNTLDSARSASFMTAEEVYSNSLAAADDQELKDSLTQLRTLVAAVSAARLAKDTAESEATSVHDKGVAEANKTAMDATADAFKIRADAIDGAIYQEKVDRINTELQFDLGAITETERDAQYADAVAAHIAKSIEAEESFPKEIAALNKTRVETARTKLVDLATSIKSARDTMRSTVQAAVDVFAAEMKAVGETLAAAQENAWSTYNTAIDQADSTFDGGMQKLANTLEQAEVGGEGEINQQYIDGVGAYAIDRQQANVNALTNKQGDTIVGGLNVAKETGHLTAVTSDASTLSAATQAEADSNSLEVRDRQAAEAINRQFTGDAIEAHRNAIEAAARTRRELVSSAYEELAKNATIEATIASNQIGAAHDQFNIQRAEAIKTRDVAIAQAWVEYIDAAVPIKTDGDWLRDTVENVTNRLAAEDDKLANAIKTANIAYVTQVADDSKALVDAIAAAENQGITTYYSLLTTLGASIKAAITAYLGAADTALTTQLGDLLASASTYLQGLFDVDSATASREQLNEETSTQALGETRADLAQDIQEADAQFKADRADDRATRVAAWNPTEGSDRSGQLAAEEAAQAQFLSSIVSAVAQASHDLIVAATNAEVEKLGSRFTRDAAERTAKYNGDVGQLQVDAVREQQIADADSALDADLLDSDDNSEAQRLAITKNRDIADTDNAADFAKSLIDLHRDYVIAQLNGDETAAEAYRQAYYEAIADHQEARALADEVWTKAMGQVNSLESVDEPQAQADWVLSSATAIEQYVVASAAGLNARELANAQAAAAKLLADSQTEADLRTARTQIENDLGTAIQSASTLAAVALANSTTIVAHDDLAAIETAKQTWWTQAVALRTQATADLNAVVLSANSDLADRIVLQVTELNTARTAAAATASAADKALALSHAAIDLAYSQDQVLVIDTYVDQIAEQRHATATTNSLANRDANIGTRNGNEYTFANRDTDIDAAKTAEKEANEQSDIAYLLARGVNYQAALTDVFDTDLVNLTALTQAQVDYKAAVEAARHSTVLARTSAQKSVDDASVALQSQLDAALAAGLSAQLSSAATNAGSLAKLADEQADVEETHSSAAAIAGIARATEITTAEKTLKDASNLALASKRTAKADEDRNILLAEESAAAAKRQAEESAMSALDAINQGNFVNVFPPTPTEFARPDVSGTPDLGDQLSRMGAIGLNINYVTGSPEDGEELLPNPNRLFSDPSFTTPRGLIDSMYGRELWDSADDGAGTTWSSSTDSQNHYAQRLDKRKSGEQSDLLNRDLLQRDLIGDFDPYEKSRDSDLLRGTSPETDPKDGEELNPKVYATALDQTGTVAKLTPKESKPSASSLSPKPTLTAPETFLGELESKTQAFPNIKPQASPENSPKAKDISNQYQASPSAVRSTPPPSTAAAPTSPTHLAVWYKTLTIQMEEANNGATEQNELLAIPTSETQITIDNTGWDHDSPIESRVFGSLLLTTTLSQQGNVENTHSTLTDPVMWELLRLSRRVSNLENQLINTESPTTFIDALLSKTEKEQLEQSLATARQELRQFIDDQIDTLRQTHDTDWRSGLWRLRHAIAKDIRLSPSDHLAVTKAIEYIERFRSRSPSNAPRNWVLSDYPERPLQSVWTWPRSAPLTSQIWGRTDLIPLSQGIPRIPVGNSVPVYQRYNGPSSLGRLPTSTLARADIRYNWRYFKTRIVNSLGEMLTLFPPKPPVRVAPLGEREITELANRVADWYMKSVDEFLETHRGARPYQGTRNPALEYLGIQNEFTWPWCDDWTTFLFIKSDELLDSTITIDGNEVKLHLLLRIERVQWHSRVIPFTDFYSIQHNYILIRPYGYETRSPPGSDFGILLFDPWMTIRPDMYRNPSHPFPGTNTGIK